MANRDLWSHDKFSEYFKSSPRRAFEFRRDTLGDAIPEEYLTVEEKEAIANGDTPEFVSTIVIPGELQDPVVDPVIPPVDEQAPIAPFISENVGSDPIEPVVENPVVTDPVVETKPEDELVEVEMTRDELKAKLDEKGITYFKGASSQKLADLCVANNLL